MLKGYSDFTKTMSRNKFKLIHLNIVLLNTNNNIPYYLKYADPLYKYYDFSQIFIKNIVTTATLTGTYKLCENTVYTK